MPVLLLSGCVGVDSARCQLWLIPTAAFELGERGEACPCDHVISQLACLVLGGQSADDWTEEGHAGGGLEVDDGYTHILACQGRRYVRLYSGGRCAS